LVAQSDAQPFGRIFLFEGRDLMVQPDAAAAERFIEPYDVQVGEIYDEQGRPLRATIVGAEDRVQVGKVRLSVADREPAIADLVARVAAFLDAVGEPITTTREDPDYLTRAASILLARQDSLLLNRRLGRLWRRLRGRFR
jgi:hypothetical protein